MCIEKKVSDGTLLLTLYKVLMFIGAIRYVQVRYYLLMLQSKIIASRLERKSIKNFV